jgi:DNA-binding Lrp family transcriptional regulator
MDDVDLRICQLLFQNSRRPQRELADLLDLNVGAVHRRIESLIQQKIISEFTANLSRGYLRAVPVQVEGISNSQSIEKAVTQLSTIDSVQSVLTAAANLTTVSLLLRDVSELGGTLEKVRKVLQMPQPNVTISMKIFAGNELLDREYTGKTELSRIDYRIVSSLQHNARKPVVDLAEDVGLTPKTVRLHLEAMERDGSIEYGLVWNPGLTTGSTFILRVDLRPGADKVRYSQSLSQKFGARVVLTFIHSNLPDSLCGYCWAPTAAQHYEMTDTISKDEEVVKASSGIVHREWTFETWRAGLLKKKVRDHGLVESN